MEPLKNKDLYPFTMDRLSGHVNKQTSDSARKIVILDLSAIIERPLLSLNETIIDEAFIYQIKYEKYRRADRKADQI